MSFTIVRVLSRNFFGGEIVWGKCALGRLPWLTPQENVSAPLSKHVYSSLQLHACMLVVCICVGHCGVN